MERKEYEQLLELQKKFNERAEKVFEAWKLNNYFTPDHEVTGFEFTDKHFEVHISDGDEYEETIYFIELPLEYLFSDTWVEEQQALFKLKTEARAKAMGKPFVGPN